MKRRRLSFWSHKGSFCCVTIAFTSLQRRSLSGRTMAATRKNLKGKFKWPRLARMRHIFCQEGKHTRLAQVWTLRLGWSDRLPPLSTYGSFSRTSPYLWLVLTICQNSVSTKSQLVSDMWKFPSKNFSARSLSSTDMDTLISQPAASMETSWS